MRVWVISGYTPYEGNSGPIAVFDHAPTSTEISVHKDELRNWETVEIDDFDVVTNSATPAQKELYIG